MLALSRFMPPSRAWRQAWCALPLLAALSGCATAPPLAALPVTPPQAASTPPSPASIGWRPEILRGRFSVQYTAQGQNQTVYGQFIWTIQAEKTSHLALLSPFGQTLAEVRQTPQIAQLELPNQAPRQAQDVDQLINDALGFPLPVSGLADWLFARPVPRQDAQRETDAAGRLTGLQQAGWQLNYQSYFEQNRLNGAGVKRLDLSRTLNREPVEIRLILEAPTPVQP